MFWSIVIASKPENAAMLPHIRGKGMMDLEYENDGKLKN